MAKDSADQEMDKLNRPHPPGRIHAHKGRRGGEGGRGGMGGGGFYMYMYVGERHLGKHFLLMDAISLPT